MYLQRNLFLYLHLQILPFRNPNTPSPIMVKKSHGASKRTSMKDKYKIQRKVKEHHRKARRQARRNLKSGSSGLRKKSDPGRPFLAVRHRF